MGFSRQEYWSGLEPKNTGVGCHALLQGIFPTQGSPCLLHCRQILHHLINGQEPGLQSLLIPQQGWFPLRELVTVQSSAAHLRHTSHKQCHDYQVKFLEPCCECGKLFCQFMKTVVFHLTF